MTSNPWHPDGEGITAGGDVGGDIQAGDAYEVRFVRNDMPGSLITVQVYAVDWRGVNGPEGEPEEYAIQTQTEYLVCTDPADPGGTEVWSDYDYEDGVLAYETLAEADQAARTAAEDELRHGAEAQEWDGQPKGCWAAQIGTTDATVTVRHARGWYVLQYSKLPERAFGVYNFAEAVYNLRVAALLDPLAAHDLVTDAATNGIATAKTG